MACCHAYQHVLEYPAYTVTMRETHCHLDARLKSLENDEEDPYRS
jgi:hypothetical protein